MAKNIVNLSLDGSNYTTRPFGTCETAAATTAKVVTCADFSLTTGATVLVKFTYANTASSPTLNVNSTGAKSIYYRGAALASSLYYWGAGDVVEFYYNGTQWDLLNVSNNNTTYSALSASDATTGTSTTGRLITAKVLHDKITAMLPSVPTISVTQTATSGNEVGKVTINGSDTTLYAPVQTTVSGNAGTATTLATSRTIDGVDFNGSANITHYGECSTAASTAAKTVSLTGFKLATGAKVAIKFTVTNTASSPTLNVNSTGAKSIMYRGSAISAGYLAANRVYEFVYDGTDYELIGDINTDSDTTYGGDRGISLASGKFGHSNTAITAKTSYVDTDADASISVATNGGSFKVTDVKYDAYGHITGSQDRTITLSESKKGTVTSITLTQGDGITVSNSGSAITSSGTRTISLNTATTDIIGGIKIAKDNSSYAVTANTSPSISADVSGDKYYAVEIDKNDKAYVYVPWTDTDVDTKDTAGAGEKTGTKMYLVGRTEQSTGTSYSNSYVYIGTDNCLYSNKTKVSLEGHTHNYLSSLPTHTHSYTELTGSVANSENQAIVSSGEANGWKLYSLGTAAQKASSTSVTSNSTDNQVPTAKAVYTAIANSFAANDAMIFKGTIGTNGTVTALPSTTAKTGWTYRVITAGTYDSKVCEVGDLIICLTDGSSSTPATWTVAQTNIDGAVTGPTESTDGYVALFNGTSGKVIKQSLYTLGCSVPAGAKFTDTVYTHPSNKQVSSGLYKITTNSTGHITAATAVEKSDITGLGIPESDTTYTVADHDTAGLIMPWKYHSTAATGPTAGSDTTAVSVNSITNTANRYYAVEMDKDGRAFVNVPWEKGSYTLPAPTTSAKGGIKVAKDNASYTVATNTSPTITANVTTAGRYYGVEIDSSDKAYVYVPWISYEGEKGITLSNNKFGHSNSVTEKTAYVDTATTASANGGSFKVTDVKYDAYGHITGSQDRTITLSESYKGTVTSITLTQGDGITVSSSGSAITSSGTRTISLNTATTGVVGGIKASNVLTSEVTLTSANGSTESRYYGVQVDSTGKAFVNVPWLSYTTKTLKVNNTSYSVYTSSNSLATIYAPTAGGTAGQVLVAVGSTSAPAWKDFSTVDLKVSSDIASISKTITTSWAELVSADNMAKYCTATGTYVVQVSGSGIGTSSGIFSWSSGGTTEDEILLHRSGATTNIYLRLKNSALQIAGAAAISTAFAITVKIKRLI